jgi:hypothetical protein
MNLTLRRLQWMNTHFATSDMIRVSLLWLFRERIRYAKPPLSSDLRQCIAGRGRPPQAAARRAGLDALVQAAALSP